MNLFFLDENILRCVHICICVFNVNVVFLILFVSDGCITSSEKKRKKTEMRALCAHPDHFSVSLPCTIIVDSLKLLKVA